MRAKPILVSVCLLWLAAIFYFSFTETGPFIMNEVDAKTGLPLLAWIPVTQPELPDGHYTVDRFLDFGVVIILHQPGPDRDFAYYVGNIQQMIGRVEPGSQFTIFQGRKV